MSVPAAGHGAFSETAGVTTGSGYTTESGDRSGRGDADGAGETLGSGVTSSASSCAERSYPAGGGQKRCVRCPDIVALAESVKNDLICIAVSYYKIEAVPAVERSGDSLVAQGVHDGVQIVGLSYLNLCSRV